MEDWEIRRVLRRPQAGPRKRGWRCPDEAALASYAEGRLEESKGDRLETHLDKCAFCSEQVAFLLRAADAPLQERVPAHLLARAEELVPVRFTLGWNPAWSWLAATAAVAALTVAVTLRIQQPEPAAPVSPVQQAPAVPPRTVEPPAATAPPVTARTPPRVERRAHETPQEFALVHPADGATLPRAGLKFRWKPLATALFYQVQVLTEEGNVVWEGRSQETSLRLPENVELAAGGEVGQEAGEIAADEQRVHLLE